MIEICGTQNKTRSDFQLRMNVCTSIAGRYSSSQQPMPAKLSNAPGGVYDDVGCARQQSQAARSDSQDVFVFSNFRASNTKSSPKLRNAPGGVNDDVRCARQQSQAARSDSQDVFVFSNFRASNTKSSQTR